jgi:hypothetical protein
MYWAGLSAWELACHAFADHSICSSEPTRLVRECPLLDSPCADGVPVPSPGGGWLLAYHQEGPDPAARDTMFTNRGLMQCITDQVPVGVLRERAPASHQTRYDVLRLALPVRWSDGRFYFESLNPRAVPVVDPVSDVLEAMVSAEVDQETAAESGALDDDYDARLRVYRQIVSRRGQVGFRARAMCKVGIAGQAVWLRNTRARTGLRDTQRSVGAIWVRPLARISPVARLRRPAMIWGAEPRRSWERSSSQSRSRSQ